MARPQSDLARLVPDTSESQTAAINDWMGLHPDPGAWAKLAKSSLESFRSWSDLGESKVSDLWQAQIGTLYLDGMAASIRELGSIQTSACTALVETQAGILNLYTDTTAQYLEFLKQAKGVEDLIATQAHIATGVQDKLKSYSLDCLQIAGLVKTAMTAWAEKALDTAAAQDERAAPVSAPRRISKKTDASA